MRNGRRGVEDTLMGRRTIVASAFAIVFFSMLAFGCGHGRRADACSDYRVRRAVHRCVLTTVVEIRGRGAEEVCDCLANTAEHVVDCRSGLRLRSETTEEGEFVAASWCGKDLAFVRRSNPPSK